MRRVRDLARRARRVGGHILQPYFNSYRRRQIHICRGSCLAGHVRRGSIGSATAALGGAHPSIGAALRNDWCRFSSPDQDTCRYGRCEGVHERKFDRAWATHCFRAGNHHDFAYPGPGICGGMRKLDSPNLITLMRTLATDSNGSYRSLTDRCVPAVAYRPRAELQHIAFHARKRTSARRGSAGQRIGGTSGGSCRDASN